VEEIDGLRTSSVPDEGIFSTGPGDYHRRGPELNGSES
jgi:hypothetical protein